MKLSNHTTSVLKNFATINQNLVIKEGNEMSTMSAMKNIVARATVEETFPKEIAIYDLNEFLGALSLFENLLLRAQKIIRKGMEIDKKTTRISLENLKVFNVYSTNENGSRVQPIILNSEGEFKTHWKDGFFAERLDELF